MVRKHALSWCIVEGQNGLSGLTAQLHATKACRIAHEPLFDTRSMAEMHAQFWLKQKHVTPASAIVVSHNGASGASATVSAGAVSQPVFEQSLASQCCTGLPVQR